MPSKRRASESKPNPPKARKPASHPNRKRGYPRTLSQAETTPRVIAPLPQPKFHSTPPRLGRADTTTPSRRSTGGAPSTSSKTNRASYTHQSHQSMTAAPRAQKQNTLDVQLEDELRNTIFHDPKFVERFLSAADDELKAIDERCRANDDHYGNNGQWAFPARVTDERQLYQPLVEILNTIKRAVDDVHGLPSSLVPQPDEEPPEPELFIDNHIHAISSDIANTSSIKPDLVLFQDDHRHWENVRMPIEVKKLLGHLKAGMKQLSRYARAVFAHQLHRRHLYGMMVCGREATFVRFDRAGILYSGRIDIVEQSELFTHAFASLLMLDRVDEGLDPAFSFERNQNGRLVYYIDLPESELVKLPRRPTGNGSKGSMLTHGERMRRFKVVERLCHRQSICGRATIVLRIQEVLFPEQNTSTNSEGKGEALEVKQPGEYVLKLIWRDPQRDSEGDVLEQVHGMFGLAQYAGHWDVSMPGKCHCPTPIEGWCKQLGCVDRTVEVDGLEVCDKLRDISVLVSQEEGEEEELAEVDTTECHATSHLRQFRIYSYVLMTSIGIPLWRAESPREFLTAALDATLGYWGLFNLGIMHRDISEGNVMMLDRDQEFDWRKWKEQQGDLGLQVQALVESERMLREVLKGLAYRDPTGMLSDFDLHARHSSPSNCADPAEPAFADSPPSRPTRVRDDDDTAPIINGAKRRKSNSNRSIPVKPQEDKPRNGREESAKRRIIDYRTGTPAFMSTQVLKVQAGQRYHHSFLDDLQSFFWLILWSVAGHLDQDQDHPTPGAQKVLNKMNRSDLESICEWKSQLLGECNRDPDQLIVTLEGFDNEWGSSGMFQYALSQLGVFLDNASYVKNRRGLESSPGSTILTFVKIIQDALDYEN